MPSRPEAAPSATPDQLAAIDAAIDRHVDDRGACLPILHAVQEALGFVPHEAIARIASALNWSRADVHGVMSYYHDFRTAPPGRHVLKICRAEACQAMGCERLAQHVRDRHAADFGETTADGALTVEPVFCLGNCALSPSVLLDGRLFGRVTPDRIDALLERARQQEQGR